MGASFSWLHVTDLHQGQRGQALFFHRFKDAFYEDLRVLHKRTGPWDLVLFTGDLTQNGSREQFDALNETLSDLWVHFEDLGSQPDLLAVPGNHDLVWPDPTDSRLGELAGMPQQVAEKFWTDPESPHRRLVSEAFANYSDWWDRLPFPRARLQRGTLPGDFTTVVEKRGFRLGVMGLNSAFLQLSRGDHEGKLHLGVEQCRDAAGGRPAEWKRRCDATLLLTHHPSSWFSQAARRNFSDEIAGYFVAHLCGHMHESEGVEERRLGASGGYRLLLGRSLFGLETWGDSQSRSHGYSIGRLSVQSDDSQDLEIWPRQYDPRRGMTHDSGMGDVNPVMGAVSVRIREPDRNTEPGTDARPPGATRANLRNEDAPFERHWYVRRRDLEDEAFHIFKEELGTPVVLHGPKDMGKSWLCKYMCHWLKHSVSHRARIVELKGNASVTTESLLRPLCLQTGAALGIDRAETGKRWEQAAGGPMERAQDLFRDLLLPAVDTSLVVAIDEFESVPTEVREEFFGLLRRWCDLKSTRPWDRLRLVLVVPRIPKLAASQSPFSIAKAINVEAFTTDRQAHELVSHYGLPAAQLTKIFQYLSGHPRWLSLAARKLRHKVEARPRDLSDAIDDVLRALVEEYSREIGRRPEWQEVLLRIKDGTPLTGVKPERLDDLYDAGFIVQKGLRQYAFRMNEIMNAALGG